MNRCYKGIISLGSLKVNALVINIFMRPRALFILKRRDDYGVSHYGTVELASGMYNSCKFIVDALVEMGKIAKLAVVIDNNDIDREVTQFKPTHVFIEGFWVVPNKFEVLKRLHPNVTWVVRCHSELPFLSLEGNGIDWFYGYLERGVSVAANSPKTCRDMRKLATAKWPKLSMCLLPILENYYPISGLNNTETFLEDELNVGCFGAIRPLKNQLIQGVAAVELGARRDQRVKFHVNAGRVEQQGQNVLKNLRALFKHQPNAELVEHPWIPREEFLSLVGRMDINFQVSFSESFNIVSADSIDQGVPIVTSSEVPWAFPFFANPTDACNIATVAEETLKHSSFYVQLNRDRLIAHSSATLRHWMKFLRPEHDLA